MATKTPLDYSASALGIPVTDTFRIETPEHSRKLALPLVNAIFYLKGNIIVAYRAQIVKLTYDPSGRTSMSADSSLSRHNIPVYEGFSTEIPLKDLIQLMRVDTEDWCVPPMTLSGTNKQYLNGWIGLGGEFRSRMRVFFNDRRSLDSSFLTIAASGGISVDREILRQTLLPLEQQVVDFVNAKGMYSLKGK